MLSMSVLPYESYEVLSCRIHRDEMLKGLSCDVAIRELHLLSGLSVDVLLELGLKRYAR